MAMQMYGVPEQPQENQFRSGVRVQTTCNQEVGDCDAVRGFRPHRRQAREAGTQDAIAEIPMRYDGKNGITGCCKDLERVSGFHSIFWIPHFGNEYEEHKMPRVGKDWVGDGDESIHECGLEEEGGGAWGEWIQTGAYHTDEACDQDGNYAGDGEPGQSVESAWEAENEGWDCEDASIKHEAETRVEEEGEGDLTGEELATCCEDSENYGSG